ncbi:prolyl oligopeptidase family serine peptidase [Roseiconus lacunae]|uniref:prolyl oligopeptidase family serine peptidase n=1 Tax=Roseiconus lacunae TaxID=2605694 RepID=UPI00190F494F|nr:prolyl oligopeptidase family serine peptidase [Roseiconus lacunae]
MLRSIVAAILMPLASFGVLADGPADNIASSVRPIPPAGIEIDQQVIQSLRQRCDAVRASWSDVMVQAEQTVQHSKKWQQATARKKRNELRSLEPEVLVFPRAVELAIELNQFYKEGEVDSANQLLDLAEHRIKLANEGVSWEEVIGIRDGKQQQLIVGGYRSKIDGSFQPYAVVVPKGFAQGDSRPRRLDLWFHGRGEKLSEVNFLFNGQKSAGQYTPDDSFVLHPYGRYSNAFKFAGEIDVLEALSYLQSRLPVDEHKIAARGFSMGGAACWQFATHYADRFFAANPGAGFSETPEFLKSFQQEDLSGTPDFQRKLWRLYDCPPWSRNLVHCPTVAYSGELDRQKQAADVMESALAEHDIDLIHVIGPQTEHKIHDDSKVEIEQRMKSLASLAKSDVPRQIDLTTYTLRYNRMHWVHVEGLQQHWEKAHVTASFLNDQQIELNTENVTHLRLSFRSGQWPGDFPCSPVLKIDGTQLIGPPIHSDRSWEISLAKQQGRWVIAEDHDSLRKRPGLQGPIDDAFMDSFLFVLPSKKSSNEKLQAWYEQEAKHAMSHWRKHFRGDIRVVNDHEVTKEMILRHHLVTFGDPECNTLLERLRDALPMQWSRDALKLGSKQYRQANITGIAIYPNPLQTSKYLVINSGFTFREYDYLNNARQTPKLPDWAIVDVTDGPTMRAPGLIVDSGFFDETWQVW